MAAAEPEHPRGHVAAAQRGVVADRLLEREERVRRALRDERGDLDLRQQRVRAVRRVPSLVRGRDVAVRDAVDARVEDVRVQPRELEPVGVHQAPGKGGADAGAAEHEAPAGLQRAVLVEARGERVPRDVRRDHVHARVTGGGDPLDPASVGAAVHAHARVSGLVQLRLRLLREPVDQRRRVARLVVRRVDLHLPTGLPEPARVPGQHVVAGAAERTEAHAAEELLGARVLVRLAGLAPAGADEHGRSTLARRQAVRREEVHADGRLVERADGGVPGLRARSARPAIAISAVTSAPRIEPFLPTRILTRPLSPGRDLSIREPLSFRIVR